MPDAHTIDDPDGSNPNKIVILIGGIGTIELKGHQTNQVNADKPYLVIGRVFRSPAEIAAANPDDLTATNKVAIGQIVAGNYTFLERDGNTVPGAQLGNANYAVTWAKFTGANSKTWVQCDPPYRKFVGI